MFFRFRRGISIHALLAESDGLVLALHRQQEVISIHALLAESDFCLRVYAAVEDISIHALLAESDFRRLDPAHIVTIFLSTLSLRRATVALVNTTRDNVISIHALLAESDAKEAAKDKGKVEFLSTLSLRRATHTDTPLLTARKHFYPRSPCGERH